MKGKVQGRHFFMTIINFYGQKVCNVKFFVYICISIF